jgi:hypothetical protein
VVFLSLPYFAGAIYATYIYPKAIAGPTASKFRDALRFLFFRYTPRGYYFGVVVITRSLCMCLTPGLFADDLPLQMFLTCLALLAFSCAQMCIFPWRSDMANLLDGVMTMGMVLLLFCGALIRDTSQDMEAVRIAGTVAFCSVVTAGFTAIAYAIKLRLSPRPWYRFFICHHRLHASAQARYLKLLLARETGGSVFIDSDNLREPGRLFDIVKFMVGILVVYLNSDTLRRPWCSGEIFSAVILETGGATVLGE